ncbi:AT-hook motif nuclear-localized protein 17-like [Coffea arabica]|uniref:AT-hook motif nuclear-localized protein 17-like n=1 Tax=Coffea arabica TaxID=13443 RepID=A0A6P6UNG0_COFAR
MKGDYVKEEKDGHSNPMFAKLHQTQKFLHHPPPPQPQPHPTTLLHHSFNPRECQASEEVDSHHRSPTTPSASAATTSKTQTLVTPSSGNDGATIEVVRRPRGRPPGSKNKPKPPVIITREAEPSMSPYVLEISGGVDILETVTTFCRKRSTGLCILNGSGTVSNVTLRQPSTTPGASVTFHGRFDILSLSATILPPNSHSFSTSAALSNGISNGFTISLAGPQGQVVGGTVVGSLFTAGTVYLIAASFNSPSFHRLPLEDERNSESAAAAAGSEGPTVSGGGGGDGGGGRSPAQGGGVDSCSGVSLYSCHLPSDVIWAPTAREPQQHPPPY